MNTRHARTVAVIRALTALGPVKRRRGRLPRQQQPDAIRLEYAKAIERLVCDRARDAFEPFGGDILDSLRRVRRREGKLDAEQRGAPELRALEPLVEAVTRAAGAPRAAPIIRARPEMGAQVGDERGVFAAYYPEVDEIALGAIPLQLLARPLALGVAGSDEDVIGCKIIVHEALHAAARGEGGGSFGIGPAGDALWIIEEATAEIAAQILLPQVVGELADLTPVARARAEAPLFRWVDGDVRLTRPTSYATWVTRIARLAALARVPLLEWVLGLRQQRGTHRIAALSRWLAVDRHAVIAYLARTRGDRDRMEDAARSLHTTAPHNAPAWCATAEPVPGELDGVAAAEFLDAEARITSPAITATDALAAIAQVDALHDARASVHVRAALQQRENVYGSLVGASAPSATPASGICAALVLAFNEAGALLLGRQREGGRWALPGGHVERGESPMRAAARELEEESNLTTPALTLVNHFTNRAGVRIWVYRCVVRGTPTGYFDPDREHTAWRFVDLIGGLPSDIAGNLAGPEDPADNVVMQLVSLRERADAVPRPIKRATSAAPPANVLTRAGNFVSLARNAWGRGVDRMTGQLAEVARRFGQRTSAFQKQELDKQVRAAMGVPFTALERPVRDSIDEWTAQNVDLVKTVGERYFDRLRVDVEDAFEGGMHPSTLAQQFVDRYEMSQNDARRLARDQIGKLNADVNHERQRSLGIDHATWRTMRDNRVSDDCFDLEGEVFNLNVGVPPDGMMPGYSHPMCRCYAEPDFSALLGDGDE